ncbi:MAG: hypothetical protein JNM91_08795, partial [Flavobacteriales bacterium]|nr:hypothetical protein [Flavobacteriales bacterium]
HVMPNSQLSEREIFHKNLMVALSALAQTKAEQLAYVHPGCAVCDLTEDFDTYGTRCLDKVEPTPAQRIAIDELRSLIRAFVATEQECFDKAVLDRLGWASIRLQAERCLNLFGYRLGPLPRPTESEPGVWRLDILGHSLQPV